MFDELGIGKECTNFNRQQYDVAPDGRFLINTELAATSAEPIHLLLNWHPPPK